MTLETSDRFSLHPTGQSCQEMITGKTRAVLAAYSVQKIA